MRDAAGIVQVARDLEVVGDLRVVGTWWIVGIVGIVRIVWIVGGRIRCKVIGVRCEARVS